MKLVNVSMILYSFLIEFILRRTIIAFEANEFLELAPKNEPVNVRAAEPGNHQFRT